MKALKDELTQEITINLELTVLGGSQATKLALERASYNSQRMYAESTFTSPDGDDDNKINAKVSKMLDSVATTLDGLSSALEGASQVNVCE